jgi:hypothetical protein
MHDPLDEDEDEKDYVRIQTRIDGVPEGRLHGVPDGCVVQPVVVNTLLYVQLHLLESGLLFDVDRLELLLRKVNLREIERFISRTHRDVKKTTPDSEKYANKQKTQTWPIL